VGDVVARVVAGVNSAVDVVLAGAVVVTDEADPDDLDPPPQAVTASTAATSSQPRRTPGV